MAYQGKENFKRQETICLSFVMYLLLSAFPKMNGHVETSIPSILMKMHMLHIAEPHPTMQNYVGVV